MEFHEYRPHHALFPQESSADILRSRYRVRFAVVHLEHGPSVARKGELRGEALGACHRTARTVQCGRPPVGLHYGQPEQHSLHPYDRQFQRGAQFQPDSRPHSLPSRPAEPQAGTARAGESAFGNHGVERFAVLHILRQFASAENAHGLSVRTARRDSHLHRFRVPHLPQLAGG